MLLYTGRSKRINSVHRVRVLSDDSEIHSVTALASRDDLMKVILSDKHGAVRHIQQTRLLCERQKGKTTPATQQT